MQMDSENPQHSDLPCFLHICILLFLELAEMYNRRIDFFHGMCTRSRHDASQLLIHRMNPLCDTRLSSRWTASRCPTGGIPTTSSQNTVL